MKFPLFFILVATTISFERVNCNNEIYNLLCNRIYFKQPSEKDFVFANILSAIYVKTNDILSGFPVYRNERGGSYFYFNNQENKFYFTKDPRSSSNFGLSVSGNKGVMNYPNTWKRTIDNDTKPFGDVFVSKDWRNVLTNFGPYWLLIEPKCVPESMTDCGSGKVTYTNYLTKSSVVVHDPKLNNFIPVPNVYQEDRMIYKHDSIPGLFIFYHSGYWTIGPDVSKTFGYFAVKSTALKPEFVTEKWKNARSNGRWVPINETIQCRGSKYTDCTISPCNNTLNSVCIMNSLNETVCTCQYGFKGDFCQSKMTDLELCKKVKEDYLVINREVGAVTSESCSYQPHSSIRVLSCYNYRGTRLDWYGYACPTAPPTTTATPTTTTTTTRNRPSPWSRWTPSPTPLNLDDNEALSISIRVLVIIIPVLLPIFHYCFYSCYRQSKDKELSTICSLCSCHAWIGVILWFMYMMLYIKFNRKDHGIRTLGGLFVAAIFFVIFGYTFVIIESFFSSVMGYLKTRFDVDNAEIYIRSLIAECPTVMTTIQCYHWETRVQQVSYTDANGNTQYRTETHQEKVVTWTECDIFSFNYWIDTSDVQEIPNFSTKEISRVKLSKEISFANDETRQAFIEQQNKFIADNRHRDTHIEHETSYDIANFKEHVMSYDPQKGLPFWMNKYWFVLCTCLCLSWPYRWMLRYYTTKKYFNIAKEISLTSIETSTQVTQPTAPVIVNIPPTMAADLCPPPSYNDAMQNAYPLKPVGRHYESSSSDSSSESSE